MEKAIVVGGAGFVGNAVVKELLKNDTEVYTIVRPGFFERGTNHRLDGLNVHVIECDIRQIVQLESMVQERGFDAWYQFAWDGLFNEPLLDYTTQIMNIKWIMDAIVIASNLGCKKFIGAGSISQYELQTMEGQTNNKDKHKVYKTAKLACEYMGRSVANGCRIEFYWPIIINIFGEGETSPRLINSMIRNLQAGKHQALSEGNQIYDFVYIDDAARAFYLIGEKGKQYKTYVIGSGDAKQLKVFLCTLRDVVAPDAQLGFGQLTFNGIYLPKELYDISAIQRDTGYAPRVSFEEGIRRTAAWIEKN